MYLDWTKRHKIYFTSHSKSHLFRVKASTICRLNRKQHAIQNKHQGYRPIWGNKKNKTTKASRHIDIVTLCTSKKNWKSLGLVEFLSLSTHRITKDQMHMGQLMLIGIARTIIKLLALTRYLEKRTILTSIKEVSVVQKRLNLILHPHK